MNINQLLEGLAVNNMKCKLYEKKNRVYLQNGKNHKFNEYIQENEDGTFSIRVYLVDKEFGDKYSPEEWKVCFQQRDKLVEKINGFALGIAFDEKGNSTDEDVSDLDVIMNM